MKPIPCSDTQLQRLQNQIALATELTIGRKLKRWRVVEQLCRGISGVDIARNEQIHPQQVSRIKKDLLNKGVAAEIEGIDLALKTRSKPKKKLKRGRPGFTRWEEWAESKGNTVDTEPFIELATLILSPDAQVAVFVVCDPLKKKIRDPDEEEALDPLEQKIHFPDKNIKKVIRSILSECSEDQCQWTNLSGIDQLIPEIMQDLEEGANKIAEWVHPRERPAITPLKERFHVDEITNGLAVEGVFTYCVLQSGSSSACEELLKLLFPADPEYTTIPYNEKLGFFKQLEIICYRLRIRWSCIGLFPCMWELYDEIAEWEEDLFQEWFVRETSRDAVERYMKASRVVQNYHALNGALLSLTPSLWSILPFEEEADFRTLALRPKIEVVRHDPQNCEVRIEPLPEVFYPPKLVAWIGDPEELAKTYRRAGPIRFHYSARPVSESKGKPATQPVPLKAKDKTDAIKEMQTVALLSRHFLSYDPVLPLEMIRELADRCQSGVSQEQFDLGGRKISCLVVNMPELLDEIKTVFRSNFYGDRHYELFLSQQSLRAFNLATRKGWNLLIAGLLEQMDSFAGPYYYFSALDLVNPKPSYDVMTRFSHRLYALEGKAETEAMPCENLDWPGEPFAYREYATFLALLTDFDADFLLTGIDQKFREKVDLTAAEWAKAVEKVVKNQYWIKDTGKPNMARITANLPPSWQTSVNKLKDDIVGAVDKSLTAFCDSRKRVARTAIETAQRLALAHFVPAAIVVEDEALILKSWRSFVRKHIRGELLAIVQRRKAEPAYADVDMAKLGGKKSTNNKHATERTREDEKHEVLKIENSIAMEEDDQDSVDEVCEILQQLIKQGPQPDLLGRFTNIARRFSTSILGAALAEIAATYLGLC